MSRSAEAVPSPELSTCPRCARLYHPPHAQGCWPCRRLKTPRPRLLEKPLEDLERAEQAEAATYYFLESFWGHPDGG